MIRQGMIRNGECLIEESLACGDCWSDIVQDLLAEGLNDEEIASLLRSQDAWAMDVRRMKADGFPYEEMVFYLTTMRATWADIGRALMSAGVSPADMLRTVLPFTEGEDHWPLVQAGLLDGPEDADYAEVRGVLGFCFLNEEELLQSLDVDETHRDRVVQRLGIQD